MTTKLPQEREDILAREASTYLARGFHRIDATRYTVVLERQPTTIGAGVHVILTLITFGAWIPFWIAAALLKRAPHRVRLWVDAEGRVTTEEAVGARVIKRGTR